MTNKHRQPGATRVHVRKPGCALGQRPARLGGDSRGPSGFPEREQGAHTLSTGAQSPFQTAHAGTRGKPGVQAWALRVRLRAELASG